MERLTVSEELILFALMKKSADNAHTLIESGVSTTLTEMLQEDLQSLASISKKLNLDTYNIVN
jgi:hypothetical protein